MMRPTPTRVPLASLMALVGIVALGLGAMRIGTPMAVSVAFNVTLFALFVGLLGAIVRRGGGGWVGFALFGWGYAVLALADGQHFETSFGRGLVTFRLIDDLSVRLHHAAAQLPTPPNLNSRFMVTVGDLNNLMPPNSFSKQDPRRSSLTPAEETAVDAYLDDFKLYSDAMSQANERQECAREVGQSLATLLLAAIGALLGRALAMPRQLGPLRRHEDQIS